MCCKTNINVIYGLENYYIKVVSLIEVIKSSNSKVNNNIN